MLDKQSTYLELATKVKDLKATIAEQESATKKVKEELDRLQLNIIPAKMEDEGVSTVNVKGVGRITVTTQMRTNVPSDNVPALKKWMRENGYGGLISEVINSSTLKSWIKERIQESEEYPADLINIYAFDQASLTKA
jgi:hypothetical protein